MTSEQKAHQVYEAKQKAMKYYAGNEVIKRMEEVLNAMFYVNPSDVNGHVVSFTGHFFFFITKQCPDIPPCVAKRMEEVLNAMFYVNPSDVNGHVVSFTGHFFFFYHKTVP